MTVIHMNNNHLHKLSASHRYRRNAPVRCCIVESIFDHPAWIVLAQRRIDPALRERGRARLGDPRPLAAGACPQPLVHGDVNNNNSRWNGRTCRTRRRSDPCRPTRGRYDGAVAPDPGDALERSRTVAIQRERDHPDSSRLVGVDAGGQGR